MSVALGRGMVPAMSRLLGAVVLALVAGVACGESNGDSGSGTTAGQPTAGQASPAGSSNAGTPNNGGSVSNAGSKSSGGGDDKGGSGAGGQAGSAGNAGQAPGGSSPGGANPGAGEGGGGTAGEGGAPEPDPRPGCSLAAKIEPTNLRVTDGAGPGGSAKLEVDVKNGSDQFVSYNPIKFSCSGAPVEMAMDLLGTFGISQGESNTIDLQLDFKDGAKPGDVAHCTVRGYVEGQTPDDCSNAPTASIDVKVE